MKVVLTAIIDQTDVATFAACTAKIGRLLCASSSIEDVSRETLEHVCADHAVRLSTREGWEDKAA